jgi:hypothetical protein
VVMESKDQRKLLLKRTKFEFQSIPECQENTLAMFGSSGGIAVQERLQRKETAVTVGLEPQGLKLGRGICSGEGGSFTTIRSGERCMRINP